MSEAQRQRAADHLAERRAESRSREPKRAAHAGPEDIALWDLGVCLDAARDQRRDHRGPADRHAGGDASGWDSTEEHAPPIIVSTAPAVLVLVDGAPVYRPVPGTPFTRLINTPALILYDATASRLYLDGRTRWMTATALGVPLNYIRGRPGDEIFLAFRNVGGNELFFKKDRLYLQFRKGRLAGWKGDWGHNWMWQ